VLQQLAYQNLVVNFRKDENTVAEHCLLSYESKKKTGAMTAASKSQVRLFPQCSSVHSTFRECPLNVP
jgi:hypothetical protein